jgi:thiol-disulfide isomerase/thioredoxin
MSNNIIKNTSLYNLIELIRSNDNLLIILLGSSICTPCRKIHNKITKYFETLDNATCIDIDIYNGVDSNNINAYYLSKGYAFTLPTILVYKNGDLLPSYNHIGSAYLNQFYNYVNNNL